MAAELHTHERGGVRWHEIRPNSPDSPDRLAFIDPDDLAALIDRAEQAEREVAASEAGIAHLEKRVAYLERRAANAEERLTLARDALLGDGYFKPDQVGADIAPRIVERLSALRHELEQWHAAYGEKALPGTLARLRTAEAAVTRVRRLCDLTIAASCRVQAVEQARDTLAVLDDSPKTSRG